jgi:hypothetical protein
MDYRYWKKVHGAATAAALAQQLPAGVAAFDAALGRFRAARAALAGLQEDAAVMEQNNAAAEVGGGWLGAGGGGRREGVVAGRRGREGRGWLGAGGEGRGAQP